MGLSKEEVQRIKDNLEPDQVAIELKVTVASGEEFALFIAPPLDQTEEKVAVLARNIGIALYNRFSPESFSAHSTDGVVYPA